MEIKEIFEDYELNFADRSCNVYINYKKLPNFLVVFDIKDLFHLLGIHKITRLRASRWVSEVRNGSFSLGAYRRHPNFRESLSRIRNYDFLYELFYRDKVKICILEKDLDRNPMKLQIIFYKEDDNKVIVLGLKKDDDLNAFKLATLHESHKNKYRGVRKTTVKKIEWIN